MTALRPGISQDCDILIRWGLLLFPSSESKDDNVGHLDAEKQWATALRTNWSSAPPSLLLSVPSDYIYVIYCSNLTRAIAFTAASRLMPGHQGFISANEIGELPIEVGLYEESLVAIGRIVSPGNAHTISEIGPDAEAAAILERAGLRVVGSEWDTPWGILNDDGQDLPAN
jgi:hypothetical protein